jgi:hypothetical protein
MSEEYDTGSAASAADAARALAAELLEQADTLDLHDLRATEAIEKVRVRSRALADAVYERGWGELFLGIDSFDPDDHDDADLVFDDFEDLDDLEDVEDLEELDESEYDVYVEGDEELQDGDPVPPDGLRLSYQARYDFVVTDPDAFVAYVRDRAVEVGSQDVLEEIQDPESAFQLLTFVDGLGSKEYDEVGLAPAGGEESQKTIEYSLWDLDPTRRDDTYPY